MKQIFQFIIILYLLKNINIEIYIRILVCIQFE